MLNRFQFFVSQYFLNKYVNDLYVNVTIHSPFIVTLVKQLTVCSKSSLEKITLHTTIKAVRHYFYKVRENMCTFCLLLQKC